MIGQLTLALALSFLVALIGAYVKEVVIRLRHERMRLGAALRLRDSECPAPHHFEASITRNVVVDTAAIVAPESAWHLHQRVLAALAGADDSVGTTADVLARTAVVSEPRRFWALAVQVAERGSITLIGRLDPDKAELRHIIPVAGHA